jgi:hypothetical protein
MTEHAKVLTRLAMVVADRASEQPLTWRLCEACRQLLGADSAAITIDNATLDHLTVASTDDLAARLEDIQEVLDQGPGRDAFLTGEPVITTLGAEAELRWPAFTEAARELTGALTIFVLPMQPGPSVLGVLTLLYHGAGSLSEELSTARFLSDAVGAALMRDPLSRAEFGKGGPWSERATVHQAIGMVCAQLQAAPEDAMALLKAHAYAHDLDLTAVATLVTSRQLDFVDGAR